MGPEPADDHLAISPGRQAVMLHLVARSRPRRPPGRRFANRGLFLTAVIHGSGLALALTWLIARSVASAMGMLHGPDYFLIVGIALVNCVVLLMAARQLAEPEAPARVRRRYETRFPAVRELRPPSCRPWQSTVVACWSVTVSVFSAGILLLTFPIHGPADHAVIWAYAACGLGLSAWRMRTAWRDAHSAAAEPQANLGDGVHTQSVPEDPSLR